MAKRPEQTGESRKLPATEQSGAREGPSTAAPIRVLLVEDRAQDAELALYQLRMHGMDYVSHRVDTEPALREALSTFQPDVVLSDFSLPGFDGLSALKVALEVAIDVPFIFVSGTIGEERAVEAVRRGAVDYVLKTNLGRLGPTVTRALAEAAARRQIARLTRVLRMLSGINTAVIRIRERGELFSEACRLAVAVGGYSIAMVLLKRPGTRRRIEPFAWNGSGSKGVAVLRNWIAECAARENSMIKTLLKTGSPFICNDSNQLSTDLEMKGILGEAHLRSLVALPLSIDRTPVGVLILAAPAAGILSDEELQMLHEVAANLSFALQYQQKDRTVRFLSHFNPHTGLARRPLFCERVARLLASGHRLAVAVMDIEHLSVINDSFGRHTGDYLLQHVSERLRRHFHDTERLAQFAGGTFAVTVDVTADPTSMSTLHAHLEAVFGRPYEVAGQRIPVSVKSGVALYPEDGQDSSALVQNAEAALRNARTTGQRQLSYSAHQHVQDKARLALEHRLRVALERRQFELHYQPKVNVSTRRLEGVEALIRWNEPDKGLVSPNAFLPLLESTELIVEVGEWVLEQSVRDCQHWQQHHLLPVRIAVNVSPVQLRHEDFVQRFFEICAPLAATGCGLDIEITEGMLQSDSAAEIEKLKSLRQAGVRIAIDDFGTGHSSLSRLAELPIDTLKIDRTFTSRLARIGSGRSVVRTILALARSFELTVVAEGVETQEELRVLTELGCDQVQGFLLAKPMPRDELTQLLHNGHGRLIRPAVPVLPGSVAEIELAASHNP